MSFGTAYQTKKHNKKMCNGGKMAEGGEVEEQKTGYAKEPISEMDAGGGYEDETEMGDDDMKDADMIARIMHKRKMYSKGGEVANDVGVAAADEKPAEFDNLVLRDDDMEDADYTGANSGDEKGDERVSDDPIDRIMMKRKKQHNPRPA
jgi:hypothetical protein